MSKNVFADLELANPEERLVKAKLVIAIRELVDQSKLTQVELSDRTGLPLGIITRMLDGMTKDIDIETLFGVINALGHSIQIAIDDELIEPALARVEVAHLHTQTVMVTA